MAPKGDSIQHRGIVTEAGKVVVEQVKKDGLLPVKAAPVPWKI